MPKHLKTRIISALNGAISHFVSPSEVSATHARGVRYFVPQEGIDARWGAMSSVKQGIQYRKHIIVRRCHRSPLLQIYTYHIPKHWSAACVANRELIKEAQRQAHALEHDHSFVGLEWRIRFFRHYFSAFKGGARPEPGMKPYSRFYQYTYVALYRQLKAAVSQEPASLTASAKEQTSLTMSARLLSGAPCVSAESQPPAFDPVPLPSRHRHNLSRTPLRRSATLPLASEFDLETALLSRLSGPWQFHCPLHSSNCSAC